MTKIAFALTLIGSFLLAGCNTVKGVGEDVQAAGRAVERAAK